MRYEHIRCKECGGTIGSFDRGESYICETCRREYPIYRIEYDTVMVNSKTGWIFPVKISVKKRDLR